MRCFGANENVCQDNWFSLYINIMRFEIFPIVMSILSSYNTFAIHMCIFVQLLLNYFIVYKKIDIILVLPVLLQTWSSSSDNSAKRPSPIVSSLSNKAATSREHVETRSLGPRTNNKHVYYISQHKTSSLSMSILGNQTYSKSLFLRPVRSTNKNFVTVKGRWLAKEY